MAQIPLSLLGIADHESIDGGRDVLVRDGYAYTGAMHQTAALVVYDVHDPTNPRFVTTMGEDLDAARGVVEISADHLLVSGRDSGSVVAVDVSDPTDPQKSSSVIDSSLVGARGLWYDGEGYAYLAVGYLWGDHENEALAVFDVSDPTAIEQVGYLASEEIDRGGSVLGVGEYLYMSGYREDSITVFDRSDPARPNPVKRFSSPVLGGTRDLAVAGDTMYATFADPGGLAVLDLANAPHLELIGSVTDDALAGARANDVAEDFVYVAARDADGVATVDVENPRDPVVVDAYAGASLEEAYGLTVHDGRVYASAAVAGALTVFGAE